MLRFAAVLLLACAPMAEAQNTDLRRLTLRQDSLGWEGVGRLDLGGSSFCTGTLIATDLVLTAAHCVFDPRRGELRAAESVTFRAGYVDGRSIAEVQAQQLVAHPSYEPRGGTSAINIRHDVALVKLAQSIPAATAAPFVVNTPGRGAREVSVVSYARGREEALSWQLRCAVLGQFQGLLAFDCDVDFGSSGAPVFDRSGQRAQIVSIISAGNRTAEGTISLGMQLPRLIADLKTAMRNAPPPASGPARRVQPGSGERSGGARFVRP